MSYIDLIQADASTTELQAYLIEGKQTAITIRIPKNLRDSAKEAAMLRGTTFSALVRERLIAELSQSRRHS